MRRRQIDTPVLLLVSCHDAQRPSLLLHELVQLVPQRQHPRPLISLRMMLRKTFPSHKPVAVNANAKNCIPHSSPRPPRLHGPGREQQELQCVTPVE